MRRKIIKQGIGGNTIFLPVKWVRENNLAPGQEVDIVELDEGLLISASGGKEQKKEIETSIADDHEPFIRQILDTLYRVGYDKITIQYQNKTQEKIIETLVDSTMLGFEVTKKKDHEIVIEGITELTSEKQHSLLRKMLLIIKESFGMLESDIKNSSYGNLEEIKTLSRRFSKYDNFCTRNISKKKFSEPKATSHWTLYSYLRLTQRSLLHLYEVLEKNRDLTLNPSIQNLIYQLQKCFEGIYEGYFKKDLSILNKNNVAANKLLYNTVHTQLKKSSGIESVVLYYCGEIARLVCITTVPMLGIIIE